MSTNLPKNWSKSNLSSICELIRGITFPASEKEESESGSNICCLRTTNVQNEIVWNNVYFVPKVFVKKDAQLVREGDILMSMANSYELVGKVALVKKTPMNATFGAFLAAIRPINEVDSRYIFYQLRTEQAQNALRMGSSQTVNIANISHQKLKELEILIAPPDEQKRIVAKLDRLLARVDSCRAHLDRAAKAIKGFRQSVLNAAVTGQLTEDWRNQYECDESAKQLLTRILDARQQTYRKACKRGQQEGLKKPKKIHEADDSQIDLPFEFPESWYATRLGNYNAPR